MVEISHVSSHRFVRCPIHSFVMSLWTFSVSNLSHNTHFSVSVKEEILGHDGKVSNEKNS